MIRNATATWSGSGKEGNGSISTQSTVLNKTQFSYLTRFADGVGTNPEELVAAAHAGCFTMKLTFVLGGMGFTPTSIETKCEITLDTTQGIITLSHLILNAIVPNITEEQFTAAVNEAEAGCLISKLYNCDITVDATLSA